MYDEQLPFVVVFAIVIFICLSLPFVLSPRVYRVCFVFGFLWGPPTEIIISTLLHSPFCYSFSFHLYLFFCIVLFAFYVNRNVCTQLCVCFGWIPHPISLFHFPIIPQKCDRYTPNFPKRKDCHE